jgi:hypothetical protein
MGEKYGRSRLEEMLEDITGKLRAQCSHVRISNPAGSLENYYVPSTLPSVEAEFADCRSRADHSKIRCGATQMEYRPLAG